MYKSLSKYSLILALILLIPAVFYLTGCNQEETQNETATETASETDQGTEETPTADAATEEPSAEETTNDQITNDETSSNDEAVEKKGGNPVVIIKTTKGDIKVELDREKAPISTDNFLAYVEDGYYDGTIFHRVINNFMIQGGGFMADGQQKPTKAPVKNEADNGLKNKRGTIAMARTGVVDSATSQFFINTVDNDFLNHGKRDFGYAVFGKVVDGMDVVDAIAVVPTGPGDVPDDQIVIESVTVVE